MHIADPALATFYRAYPDFELESHDFLASAAQQPVSAAETATAWTPETEALLRRYQRLLPLCGSQHVAQTLGQLGYHSAHAIAAHSSERFVERCKQALGGQAELAQAIHRRALHLKNQVIHLWANVQSVRNHAIVRSRASKQSDDWLGDIRILPSYQDLFGAQDFCSCEPCKSIFGPAAYFVDLMRITDRYVSTVNQHSIPRGYRLVERRADLFTLELSCAGSNEMLPYLQIVNAVLERLIARESGQKDVSWLLATAAYPLMVPDNPHQRRIMAALEAIDLTLSALYASTSGFAAQNAQALAQQALNLSLEQAALVCTPLESDASLKSAWGLRATQSLHSLSQLSRFAQLSALTRKQIEALTRQELNQEEITAGLAHTLWFNHPLPAGQAVQIVTDGSGDASLNHLGAQTLDRLNRFIRFSQWSRLGFSDLSLALCGLGLEQLDGAALQRLAAAHGVVRALGWSWAQASSLWSDMPTSGRGDGDEALDLFDRVWNTPALCTDGAIYRPRYALNPLFDDPLVSWMVAEHRTSTTQFGVARLRAALMLDDETLSALAALAFPGQQTVALSVANLSTLYRLNGLMQASGFKPGALGQVAGWLQLDLTRPLPVECIADFLVFAPWLQACALSVEQVGFFLTPSQRPEDVSAAALTYNDMLALWNQMLPALFSAAQLQGDNISSERADAIYQALQNLSPARLHEVAASYAQVLRNLPPGAMSLVPERLSASDLAPLALPPLALTPGEMRQVLLALHSAHDAQGQLLNAGLASVLGSDAASVAAQGALIVAQMPGANWITALLIPGEHYSPVWQGTAATLAGLSRLNLASASIGLSAPVLQAMSTQPAAFDLGLETLFSLQTLRAFQLYGATRNALAVEDPPLLAYLALPPDSACRSGEQAQACARLSGWDPSELCAVLEILGAGPQVYARVSGLSRLCALFGLLQRGGFGATSYRALLETRGWSLSGEQGAAHWQAYAELADTIEGSVCATLGLSAWQALRSRLQARQLERARDARLPTLLWYYQTSQPEIATPDQLSGYLLLDVARGGCFQTSKVLEATAAVQGYLSRARANIESGIDSLPIPEVWWQWLDTYRRWEANRRVFVYPENYLDPNLRRSRTRLFQQLEADLLQSDITPQRVDAAYRNYIAALGTLASLVFIDAYRATVQDSQRGEIDTLFVFARSATEPYQYYSAKQECGAVWSEWSRIDVTIKSPYVTPVYAFGRLLVFWVEQSVVSNTAIETENSATRSQNSVVYKASIRYSFMDAAGNWVADQTLSAEQVVYATPNQVKLSPQSGYDLFNMHSLFWQKCNVLAFSAGAAVGPEGSVRVDEKIAVLYGPFLENSANGSMIDSVTPPLPERALNPAVLQFEIEVYRRSRIVNQAIASGFRGQIGLREPWLLNREMQRDYLFQRAEFLNFADNYSCGVPPTIAPLYDYAMNRLYVRPTLNVFRSNYYGDWNNRIEGACLRTPLLAATLLFPGVTEAGAAQIAKDLLARGYIVAETQGYRVEPGFNNNADFRFLLNGDQSRNAGIIRLWVKRQLLAASIGKFRLDAASFIMTALNEHAGAQALIDLQAESYIDAQAYVTPFFNSTSDLSHILYGAPRHEAIEFTLRALLFLAMGDPQLLSQLVNRQCSTHVVKNQPAHFVANVGAEAFLVTPASARGPCLSQRTRALGMPSIQSVTPCSFVSGDIPLKQSQQVFELLQSHGLIDAQGRIMHAIQGDEDLSFLFADDLPQSRQIKIAQVRVVLIDLPTMTLVNYYAENDQILISPRSFYSMGLTPTAAQLLFDTLSTRGAIGAQGMISPQYDPHSALPDLFPDLAAQKAALLTADVARILQDYFDTTWKRDIHDLYYDFNRLSSAALPRLSAALLSGGVDCLLDLSQQQAPLVPELPFSAYAPGARVHPPRLNDATEVDFDGVYGIYFWELFFHSPRLIADALLKSGNFQAALRWIQYIFNPTERLTQLSASSFQSVDIDGAQSQQAFSALKTRQVITAENQVAASYRASSDLDYLFPAVTPQARRSRMQEEVRNVLFNHQTSSLAAQFWRFQPLRNQSQQTLLAKLSSAVQIAAYNRDPYDPYAIAGLRTGAFEQAVFCSYIDLLLAWGDDFYQGRTRESLNAAALLYQMASELLGPRPQALGECKDQLPVSFEQIQQRYAGEPGAIPQFLIDMENLLQVRGHRGQTPALAGGALNDVDALFCVPPNELLLARWDRVEDRCFKIRHCLDLEGQPLTLPLLATALDPMSLVRAAAQSASGSGFAELAPRQPTAQFYRLSTLIANARSLVANLQGLGNELEQSLAGRNSEALMILQTRHEQDIYQAQLRAYDQRRCAALSSLEALQASRAFTLQRKSYYDGLVSQGMIAPEILSITFGLAARIASFAAIGFETGAAIAAIAPQVGSPFAMTYGGEQIELGLHRSAGTLRQIAEVADTARELSDNIGQFQRLSAEWREQASEAGKELLQIERQIDGARAELAASEADYKAHISAQNNLQAQLGFLENKFDNPDYYAWRVSRASALYYQSYQLALQAVDAAQSALQWQQASMEVYLTANPWDAGHRGLMAAYTLDQALDRMEFACSQQDSLRQEISCEIYLSQLAPAQLLQLRASGSADFSLPEAWFDFDFPGHYCRRIKTVALSLLPLDSDAEFEAVHAIITQTGNKILRQPSTPGLQYMLDGSGHPGDTVWVDWRANQTVSLSRRSRDEGAFVEYYGDGERLQRFEGSGAVSTWHYQLPPASNQFEFSAIEDLRISLRYSALNGGAAYQRQVQQALAGQSYRAALMLNLLLAYPDNWQAFYQDRQDPGRQTLRFDLADTLFPPHVSHLQVNEVTLSLVIASGLKLSVSASFMCLSAGQLAPATVSSRGLAGSVPYPEVARNQITGNWELSFDLRLMAAQPELAALLDEEGHIDPAALLNLFLSLQFTATVFK